MQTFKPLFSRKFPLLSIKNFERKPAILANISKEPHCNSPFDHYFRLFYTKVLQALTSKMRNEHFSINIVSVTTFF